MNDSINGFVNSFREALGERAGLAAQDLERQKEKDLVALDASKRNDFNGIMGSANTLGMMYSNFPKRTKEQYLASTYEPNKVKIQDTYQTGLDKLRSNSVNYINQLAEINEAINDLNERMKDSNDGNKSKYKAWRDLTDEEKAATGVDYGTDQAKGSQYFKAGDTNSKIRMGTFAKNLGATTTKEILDVARDTLNTREYNQLKTIVDMNQGTKLPNLGFNVGKDYVEMDYGKRLSPEDTSFLNRLGLKLTN